MKYDVCVFGGCSLDQMFYQKTDGSYSDIPEISVPGGKGSNQAVAAARAGAKTAIISRIGKDEIGKSILENLKFNMVHTAGVEMVEGLDNDCSSIYINLADKDNDIKRVVGAIDSFTPDMVDRYADTILSSRIVLSQLKAPKEVTERLINFCHENNKFLILTPCRPQKLSVAEEGNLELIDKIDLITCNQKECETIFGTDDVEDCVRRYPNKLIVTLGSNGLMYYNGERIIKMPSIMVDVLDTVGAGDTLCGNLAAALAAGLDLQHALRRAMYASTMKIKVKTAQAGMPYKEDLDSFIAETRTKAFEYYDELNFALDLVKKAYENSKTINSYKVSLKENSTLVTDADLEIEGYMISRIRERYPRDNFLTEETNSEETLKDRTWIIDPIDGTTHFIKGDNFWGIQIAFYDKEKTKFSIVYLPKTNECYYAAEKLGAYVNNNRILPHENVPMNQAIVEFGGSIYKEFDSKKILLNRLLGNNKMKVAGILHINSCCISFTNLASGKIDALIIATRKLWDILPGMFILEELGIKSHYLDFEKNLILYTNNDEIKDTLFGA